MYNKNLRTEGVNLTDVQNGNRSLVLRLLQKNPFISRTELALLTGLRQATITNIVNEFIKEGLVVETGPLENKRGRAAIGLRIKSETFRVISARIARKYVEVGLFDIGGNEYYSDRMRIQVNDTPRQVLYLLKTMIQEVLDQYSSEKILGIGVALPGPFYKKEGRIALMSKFGGWSTINIREELENSFQLPIYMEHDANCGAIAEMMYGKNYGDIGTHVYVAAGQGVGAGIITDGTLYCGSLGIAGEIGHMSINYEGPECECGNRGCLELYCSTIAVLRYVEEEFSKYPDTILSLGCRFEDVVKAAENEDALAVKAIQRAGEFLAIGLANVLNIVNPDSVVIGDELSKAGFILLEVVRNKLQSILLPQIYKNVTICITSFKKDAELLGASALIANAAINDPSLLQ